MPFHEKGRLLTVQQIAGFLNVTSSQLKRWRKAGHIRPYKLPDGKFGFYENDVKKLQGGGESNDGVSADALRALQQRFSPDGRAGGR